jgi:hypothetical protein
MIQNCPSQLQLKSKEMGECGDREVPHYFSRVVCSVVLISTAMLTVHLMLWVFHALSAQSSPNEV